jgi:integrase
MAKELLTDRKVQTAKAGPNGEARYYADGGGLYVVVRGKHSQSKSFVFRGVLNGRRLPMIAIGPVKKWSLKEARGKRDGYQKMLNAGKDPRQEKLAKRINGAEAPPDVDRLLAEYFQRRIERRREHDTDRKQYDRIAKASKHLRHISDRIGKMAVKDVKAQTLLKTVELEKLWTEKHPTAIELRRHLRLAFDIAVAANWIDENPARDEILGALLPHHYHKKTSRPALDYVDAPRFMAAVIDYKNRGLGRIEQPLDTVPPLLFLLLTGVRSGEVRYAKWGEIDWENLLWDVPWENRKLGHTKEKIRAIPISKPMLVILEEMQRRNPRAGDGDIIFPGGSRDGTVAKGSINGFIKRSLKWDVHITVHGFRTTLETWANAQRGALAPYYPLWVQRQLDHSANVIFIPETRDKIKTVAGYTDENRPGMTDPTLDGRREMMKEYAEYLIGSGVMPFHNPSTLLAQRDISTSRWRNRSSL